jgi:hypothetical protein
MNIEREISKKCLDIYQFYQQCLQQRASGFLSYDPPALERLAYLIEVDCVNCVKRLKEHIPSLESLEAFSGESRDFNRLSSLAYHLYCVRFSHAMADVLLDVSTELSVLFFECKLIHGKLVKERPTLNFDEAIAMAWDRLPPTAEIAGEDILIEVMNPFWHLNEDDGSRDRENLYRFRFYKSYLNGICLGWKFYDQEV